jgi:RNA polymerase sigma factor (sigma-70 family)
MAAIIYIKGDGSPPELTSEQQELFTQYRDQAHAWARAINLKLDRNIKREIGETPGEESAFADFILLHAVRTYDPSKDVKFTTWLYKLMEQQAVNLYHKFKGEGDVSLAEPVPSEGGDEVELEQLLKNVEELRAEDVVAHGLLRDKIKQSLEAKNPRLFEVYKLRFEQGLSNPETGKAMKLSPSRISGLEDQIITILKELPEIKERMEGTSSIRHFLFRVGDKVFVSSIQKFGTVIETYKDNVLDIKLDYNGNIVRILKSDVEKYSSLIESGQQVVDHYFRSSVYIPRCYVSLVSDITGSHIAVLEFRPTSEKQVTAKLYMDNDLMGIAYLTPADTAAFFTLLKGHINSESKLNPPFMSL